MATAHALCVSCVIADAGARALRLQLLVHALGAKVGFLRALAANAAEDAGAALTPMRLGGTATRMMMLSGSGGVPVPVTMLAGVAEGGLQTPLVLLAAAAVGAVSAPDWWRTVAPALGRSAVHAGWWMLLAVALGVVAWMVTRRLLPHRHHSWKQSILDPLRAARRVPPVTLVACAVLSAIAVVSRVAILPLLAATTHPPPAVGAVTLSSLVLLYGQILLPTPSGAGAVELGILAGGAGVIGDDTTTLLLAWRAYTTFVPIVAGLLAMGAHGTLHLRRRARPSPPAGGPPPSP